MIVWHASRQKEFIHCLTTTALTHSYPRIKKCPFQTRAAKTFFRLNHNILFRARAPTKYTTSTIAFNKRATFLKSNYPVITCRRLKSEWLPFQICPLQR